MPAIADPGVKAVAHARACEPRLTNAYGLAGVADGRRDASRLANQPEVAARIGELIAVNKPENRPNKPETARFRLGWASLSPPACRAARLPAQPAIVLGDDA